MNRQSLGATEASAAGEWSFQVVTAIEEGERIISARALDNAGNLGQSGVDLTVRFDATAPPAPASPDLIAASDTGRSETDNITADTTPTFSGTAESWRDHRGHAGNHIRGNGCCQ